MIDEQQLTPQGIAIEHGLINRFKSLLVGWSFWSDRQVIKRGPQMMTALHILCANPFVTADSFNPCLSATIIKNSTGMTALHILCSLS